MDPVILLELLWNCCHSCSWTLKPAFVWWNHLEANITDHRANIKNQSKNSAWYFGRYRRISTGISQTYFFLRKKSWHVLIIYPYTCTHEAGFYFKVLRIKKFESKNVYTTFVIPSKQRYFFASAISPRAVRLNAVYPFTRQRIPLQDNKSMGRFGVARKMIMLAIFTLFVYEIC